jgi:hypothetical protein
MLMVLVPVAALCAGFVTVHETVTVEPVPAVKVTALELWPAVIVPPLIVHE